MTGKDLIIYILQNDLINAEVFDEKFFKEMLKILEVKERSNMDKFLGKACVFVIASCISAITIALTIKLIMWMF